MRGLNDRFKKKPEEFLHEVVLQESAGLVKAKLSEGVYNFDLEPSDVPTIALFGRARVGIDPDEASIKAYWLPWQPGSTLELESGDAEYFFTAHLGGCQLRVVPPAGAGHLHQSAPHCRGHRGKIRARPRRHRMEGTTAVGSLKPSEWHRSRAFSSTTPYPDGYEGSTDVQVVGFKNKFHWEFWAQETGDDFTKVSRLWRIY